MADPFLITLDTLLSKMIVAFPITLDTHLSKFADVLTMSEYYD